MGSVLGVTVGDTVVNWIIKNLEKRFDGKKAKFVTGTLLFRVIKVTAAEGRRWFEWLGCKLADGIQGRSMQSNAHRKNEANFMCRMNGSTLVISSPSRDQE